MKILGRDRFSKQIAACLVVLSMAPAGNAAELPSFQAPAQQQPAPQPAQQQPATPAQPQPAQPDQPQQPAAPGLESRDANTQSQQDQPNTPQKPVGTAAAPVTKPSGVAGSRPAGAVIAPSKQHRVRRLVVRFGLIIGGAAAIGTVAALSHGSPSRP